MWVSGVLSARRRGMTNNEQAAAEAPYTIQQLVIAFHGTFLFNYWPYVIEVIVPRVAGHMYLVEEEQYMPKTEAQVRRYGLLDGRTLALAGVQGQAKPYVPDSRETIVVRRKRHLAPTGTVFCRLLVPHPNRIDTRLVNVPQTGGDIFTGPSASEVQTRRFPACLVFTYDKVISSLTFGELPWRPTADERGVVHLRIYAESILCPDAPPPLGVPGMQHVRHAFHMLVSLLPDMDIDIAPGVAFQLDEQTKKPIPPANDADLENLRIRLGIACPPPLSPPADCGHFNNVLLP